MSQFADRCKRATFVVFKAAFVATTVLSAVSCQTDPVGPTGKTVYTAKITSIPGGDHRQPERAAWKVDADTGSTICSSFPCTLEMSLTEAPKDTVEVDLWRAGVHYMTVGYIKGTDRELTPLKILSENVVAIEVLKAILPSTDHAIFVQELAKRLVANDSVVRGSGFPTNSIVTGIDNNAVLDSAMSILVAKGLPLSAVIPGAGTWALGLDTLSVHVRVKALVAAGKISADTAKLFPPYPVRVKSPVTLDSVLVAGGATIPVKGAFEATYQLSGKLIRVFRDTQDVSALFDISSFELLERPKSFDLSGKFQIGAKESAVPGPYRLEIMFQDDSLRKAVSSASFRVAPAADKVGPIIEILSPASGTVLDNATATVSVKVKASDASGVDSVWISDKFASFADGSWSVDSVGIPVTDIGFVVVVRAKDGKGNTASKDILVGRKAKLDPGAPSWTVLSPKSNELYPFDSSTVAVRWKVIDPRASIVSVTIGGGAASEEADGIWTRRIELPATGFLTTIPLVAANAKGDTIRGFVQATRQADSKGPAIQIKSPVDGTVFSYEAQSVLVKLAATDPSGVDSLKVNGKRAESASTEYVYSLALEAGKDVVVRVEAWDKFKNRSIDSIVVSRKGLPDTTAPTLKLLGPSSGTELALETESVTLRWLVTDPSGLADTSVKIDGKVAKRNTDTFSLEVVAPAPGREEIHRIDAKNNKGVSNFETMSLKRAKDVTAPKLLRVDSGRTVPFETEKAVVSWKVTDNDKLGAVTIADKLVVGVDGLYSLEVALTTGDNRIAITATDSARNSSSDTIVVHRTWKDTSKPVLVRQPGTEDKNVAFATTEFTASWKATDNALSRVKINDTAVTGVDGIYSYKATLAQASTKFKIEAIDVSGNSKLDSITVTKSDDLIDPVAVRLPGTQDTTVPYTTSGYALGWEVRDDNGVDSVTVNGLAATKNEASYRLTVALPTVGQHRFIMVAKDLAGNDTRDTVRIRRAYHDSIAPQKTRGVSTKDTTAPYGTKTYTLSWTVTDNDMVKSVTIGSGVATVSGNVYSRKVDLVDGPNKFGMLAIDTAGNKATDTVTIKVAADSAVPAISREVGTKDSAVAYGTTSISLKWKITDDAGVSSVKVNGVLVSSSSGVYTWSATGLNIGANVFRIVAVDVVNKSSSDSVVITRAWKDSVSPVVSRHTGTGPARVASTIDTAALSWSVSDSMLKEVRLNDVALVGQAGVFTKTINLVVGSNPVVLVAEDRAGNLTTDTFTIFRNEPPRYGLLPYPEIVGRYPGSDPTLDPYLKAAWEKWKANFLTDGTVYAATPSGTNQLTSEGQAYGMLLALWFGDQAVFDRIWWATESRLWNGSDRWYNWAVGDRTFAGGADIQICGALIMASALVDEGLWPDNMIPTSGISYKTKAKTLIQSISSSIIDKSFNYRVNTWPGAGDGIRNPSYHMPAWYAVFKEFSALNGLTGMNWDAATKGAHDLFDAQPFASVGMVRNYSTGTGGTANGGTSTPTNYDMGFDAIKVPWLQALANTWHHDVRAGSWCAKVWKGGVVSPEAAGMYQLSSSPRLWGWMLGEYERVMTMGMWGACAVSVRDSSTEAKTASESLSKTMIDALRSDAAFSVRTKDWHAQTNALLGTLAITGRAWNVWSDLKNLCSPCGP